MRPQIYRPKTCFVVVSTAVHGSSTRPAGRVRMFCKTRCSSRVGSGDVRNFSRVGSSWVGSGRIGSGRVGSGNLDRSRPVKSPDNFIPRRFMGRAASCGSGRNFLADSRDWEHLLTDTTCPARLWNLLARPAG